MRARRAASDAAFGRFGRTPQPGRRIGDAPKSSSDTAGSRPPARRWAAVIYLAIALGRTAADNHSGFTDDRAALRDHVPALHREPQSVYGPIADDRLRQATRRTSLVPRLKGFGGTWLRIPARWVRGRTGCVGSTQNIDQGAHCA